MNSTSVPFGSGQLLNIGSDIIQVEATPVPNTESRSVVNGFSLADPSIEMLRLFGGGPSLSGVDVNENTAMSLSTVWACVRNLSEDVAGCPWTAYLEDSPRGKKRIIAHPLFTLLASSPNPEMIPFEFRQAMMAMAVLWGSAYAEIERDRAGRPIALWPIPSWQVIAKRDSNRNLYYEVRGQFRIEPKDMFRIGGFSNNGIVGYWLAREARDSWGLALAAERFACSFYRNGTNGGGVISTEGVLGEMAKKNLRDGIEAMHAGPGKAFKLLILQAGLKWQETRINAEESQMTESRQFQVEEVARWFRMPPHLVQSLARATFNNIEHQSLEYVNFTIHPWTRKWTEEGRAKLTRPDELVFAEMSTNHLTKGDNVARHQGYKLGVECGMYTPNQCLSFEGHNPYEGGDIHIVPANFMTVEAMALAAQAKKVEVITAKTDAGLGDDDLGQTPEDIDGGEIDQEDSKVVQGDYRPPPVEVLAPGSQPGLDSTFTGFRNLASTQLQAAMKRLLHMESDKVTRAAKKDDFRSWAGRFYKDHATHVAKAISPVIQTLAESVWTARGINPSDEQRAKVKERIDAMAQRHVESSTGELADLELSEIPTRVSGWEECRIDLAADVEQLVELMKE